MKIVSKKITDLRKADYNPRKLSAKQRQDLSDNLKKFGMVDPIIVNTHAGRENIIIGGHQRVSIWSAMGNTDIPCVELNLPEDLEKELNVRLNKNTGEFDFDILVENFEIDDLIDWGFVSGDFFADEPIDIDEEPAKKDDTAKIITCPKCGFDFGDV